MNKFWSKSEVRIFIYFLLVPFVMSIIIGIFIALINPYITYFTDNTENLVFIDVTDEFTNYIDLNSVEDKNGTKRIIQLSVYKEPTSDKNGVKINNTDVLIYLDCINKSFAVDGLIIKNVNGDVLFKYMKSEIFGQLEWQNVNSNERYLKIYNLICLGDK
ncbi:MAG: surface-adhesin E family protein [Thermodesulfobacteriota bacterium]